MIKMGETRQMNQVTLPCEPYTYPVMQGDVIAHPTLTNQSIEVLDIWDNTQPYSTQNTYDVGLPYNGSNPYLRKYTTPEPKRDLSEIYPIYYCRVNGVEQWLVFDWIRLDALPSGIWLG
jgi:hypothetical protein